MLEEESGDAGVLLIGDHSTIYGSLAFGCFFLAAAWLEFEPQLGTRRSYLAAWRRADRRRPTRLIDDD
jgi:hypothetical protein